MTWRTSSPSPRIVRDRSSCSNFRTLNIGDVQCKIKVNRTIYYCGVHSHVSVVYGGRRIYLHELAASNCKHIHKIINLGRRDDYMMLNSSRIAPLLGASYLLGIPQWRVVAAASNTATLTKCGTTSSYR